MPVVVIPVSWDDYHRKLKKAVLDLGAEPMNNPDSIAESGREVYNTIGNAAIYYDVHNRVVIAHANKRGVEKTLSELRQSSGLELKGEYMENGRQTSSPNA